MSEPESDAAEASADAPSGAISDASAEPTASAPPEPAAPRAGFLGAPRVLVLLLAAAAAVIVVDGMRGLAFILGPSFLALVLVIVVYPVQASLVRRGAPGWVGLMTGFVGVTLIVVAIGGSVFLALARFASILPQYSDEAQKRLDSLMSKLDSLGIHTDQQKAMSEALDPSRLAAVLGDVLSGLASLSSSLFFLITVLLFMTLDAFGFPAQLQAARKSHPAVVDALVGFAHGTRTYLVVSTIFGFIVAVIDTIVLAMIGVPAAVAWGVLAFVTNYIPNIGFVIGLIPPALLALLDGGWSEMLLVIAAYSIINFIIQSLIQPKFVADAVGISPTLTIISLFFWAYVLGALGALLAIPLSLLMKALLVDSDRGAAWLRPLIGGSSARAPASDAPPVQT